MIIVNLTSDFGFRKMSATFIRRLTIGLSIILFVAVFQQSFGLQCGIPGRPAYGGVVNANKTFNEGESVSYYCNNGYYMVGPIQRRCLPNGTWTGNMPVCDTTLSPIGYTSAAESLSLYPPELAVDGNRRSCWYSNRKKPRWWRMDMGQRTTVISVSITVPFAMSEQHFTIYVIEVNGTVTKYQKCASFAGIFSSQAMILVCAKDISGHLLHIEDNLNALDYFGICEVEVFVHKDIYECGFPEQPMNGNYVFSSNQKAEYHCDSGYRMEGGSPVRWCLKSGQWSGGQPVCRQVSCSKPGHIEHGIYHVLGPKNNGRPLLGSRLTFGCKAGYYLVGNESRICGEDGNWIGSSYTPSCHPIDCGLPPEKDSPLLGGKLVLKNGTTFTSVAELVCYSGHKPGLMIKCREDGSWSKLDATCLYQSVNYLYHGDSMKNSNESTSILAMILAFMVVGVMFMILILVFFLFKRKILQFKWATEPPDDCGLNRRRGRSSWALDFLRNTHLQSLGRPFSFQMSRKKNMKGEVTTTVATTTTNSSVKSNSSKFEQHIYQEIDKFGSPLSTISGDHAEKIRKAAMIAAEIAAINEKRRSTIAAMADGACLVQACPVVKSQSHPDQEALSPTTVTTAVYAKVDFAQKRRDRFFRAVFSPKPIAAVAASAMAGPSMKEEQEHEDVPSNYSSEATTDRRLRKTLSSPGSIYALQSQTMATIDSHHHHRQQQPTQTINLLNTNLIFASDRSSSSGSSSSSGPTTSSGNKIDIQVYGLN